MLSTHCPCPARDPDPFPQPLKPGYRWQWGASPVPHLPVSAPGHPSVQVVSEQTGQLLALPTCPARRKFWALQGCGLASRAGPARALLSNWSCGCTWVFLWSPPLPGPAQDPANTPASRGGRSGPDSLAGFCFPASCTGQHGHIRHYPAAPHSGRPRHSPSVRRTGTATALGPGRVAQHPPCGGCSANI